MKKSILSIALALAGICGCSSIDDRNADIPPTADYGNSLMQVDAVADAAGDFLWQSGDRIIVTDGKGNSGTYEVSAGIGTVNGEFKGCAQFDAFPLYAIYPGAGTIDGMTARLAIASVQDPDSYRDSRIMIAECMEQEDGSAPQFMFSGKTVLVRLTFDFSSVSEEYSEERVSSIEISADNVNFTGDCTLDLANPSVKLEGTSNTLTYRFLSSVPLSRKIDASVEIAPCDLTSAAHVTYTVRSDRYTFIFSRKPDNVFEEGETVEIPIVFSEFTQTENDVPAEGEVKIIRELPALDLSAGGNANCYIVSQEARCSFDATVMGNGDAGILAEGNFTDWLGTPVTSSKITPVSAELLWQSPDNLVTDVTLVDGRVNFNSTGAEGNAVIAVYDSQGQIMWSWHIWLTDTPADQQYMENRYGNTWTFMDRNLGATSAVDDGNDCYGILYQWGRKDPIPGARAFNSLDEPEIFGKITEVSIVVPDASTGTISYSIRNPVTYLQRANWLMENNDWLWGNPEGYEELAISYGKTIYDPCPPGYKMPGRDAYSIFTTTGENTSDTGEHNVVTPDGTKRGYYLYYEEYGTGKMAWYPTNGSRNYQTGSLTRGSYWYYWTSAPASGTQACCLTFRNNWADVNPMYVFQRGNANTARCVRE